MHDSLPTFHILPVGWERTAWKGGFYPDDLPKEWRLSYFANEFPAVVVSRDSKCGSEVAELQSWVDDVSESFQFYLQVSEAFEPSILDEAGSIMDDNLGGLVVSIDYSTHTAWRDHLSPYQEHGVKLYRRMEVDMENSPTNIPDGTGVGLALWITNKELGGLSAQRRFLEQLRDKVTADSEILVCLANPSTSIESLRDFRQLAQLMGLA